MAPFGVAGCDAAGATCRAHGSISSRTPTSGSAMALMLTLKPKMEINQAVTVVPILAPMMTPMDSVRVNNPALAKLTTIRVVADDD